jgi:hypothetical protein
MKRILVIAMAFASLAAAGKAGASSGHYVNGIEGLRAATLPPPGVYWRLYNVYYCAGQQNDRYGNKIQPNFKLDVYALVNRLIWSTDLEILGANLVMDVIVPVNYTSVSLRDAGSSSFSDQAWGVGDPAMEPLLLAWHGARYDAVAGAGVFFPVGAYDANRQASAGKGFWTFMLTAGGTVYFDEAKTWHASVLSRYQINTRLESTGITNGNVLSFEWGLGKTLMPGVSLGVAGYCSWQVTKDWGPGATDDRSVAYAVGPELTFPIPLLDMGANARFLWEFENKNNPQGFVGSLTLTKRF